MSASIMTRNKEPAEHSSMGENEGISRPNVAVVTYPFSNMAGETGEPLLAVLLDIWERLFEEIFVITGNFPERLSKNTHIIRVKAINRKETMPLWFFKQVLIQLRISLQLVRVSKKIEGVVFYLGGAHLLLPMLVARLLRKKTIMIMAGAAGEGTKRIYRTMLFGLGGYIISRITRLFEKLNYALTDVIGVPIESPDSMAHFLKLEKYKNKIMCLPYYFIDSSRFRVTKDLAERENIVGYVGRLSPEKGVIELAKSVPLVLSRKENVRFLIIGDGPLMGDMKNELREKGCLDKVEFVGWIPNERIPDYLNRMKVHIIPSHTEAFSGTSNEAMACGTIVIGNSVGGIPDIIKDNKTGFLLRDNQPQTMADKIIEVLNSPELEKIQKNALDFIEETLSMEKVVERGNQALSILARKQ